MKTAFIFPGQGAQFPGMGKVLYDQSPIAKKYFQQANDILRFDIANIMFHGSEEDLRKTKVTQPAIFLHSVIATLTQDLYSPDVVAGHSLGEFSALVANGTLSFEDGLQLVDKRAKAMQKCCDTHNGAMSAVLGLEDGVVEKICQRIEGVVVAANFNCPGQVVISGEVEAIKSTEKALTNEGAKRVIRLAVSGAFHSLLMQSAQEELEEAINNTNFNLPTCPIYQNVDASIHSEVATIKKNLSLQLISPVRWSQSVQNMLTDSVSKFVECGPGKVLQGLVKKIDRQVAVDSIEST